MHAGNYLALFCRREMAFFSQISFLLGRGGGTEKADPFVCFKDESEPFLDFLA